MNVCSLVGTVARTPIVKFEGDGHQLCTFTLAVPERSYGPEAKTYMLFVPMCAYGKAAGVCGELHQADLVAVQGKLSWQKRVGKCKQEHSTLCVRVQDVHVLTPATARVA
jgi:single-stranded DNA-binding protein